MHFWNLGVISFLQGLFEAHMYLALLHQIRKLPGISVQACDSRSSSASMPRKWTVPPFGNLNHMCDMSYQRGMDEPLTQKLALSTALVPEKEAGCAWMYCQ